MVRYVAYSYFVHAEQNQLRLKVEHLSVSND